MEYHVRTARLTDIDDAIRVLTQDEASDAEVRRDNSNRLRSLLSMPSATVIVAEAGRRVVGLGVLSIRPSVRSGPFVAMIDELDAYAGAGVPGDAGTTEPTLRNAIWCSILEQLVASAHNKGCTRVEVTDPLASAEPSLLKQAGFASQGTLLSRAIG